MKLSFNWLKEFVEIPAEPEEAAERLTMAGLEVEALKQVGSDLARVVVGQVLSISGHPQADGLTICEVDVARERLLIVCGATNVKAGHRVPVALPGSFLPGGKRIEAVEVKGVLSQGMLCSEGELGLGEETREIMLLPDNLELGQSLTEALDLEDIVLEVAVTPNRGDCLSHLGIARELSVLFGTPLRLPRIKMREEGSPIGELTSVEVLDRALCPRYTARIVLDIAVKPSPFWLRRRLNLLGFRSINNVVDATNYVMLELGQPLHAFDYERLRGRRIVVRRAQAGEQVVTLDGMKRVLSPEILVIADASSPVAIAGVMGGAGSEVGPETKATLLESAYFNSTSVRRASKALGLTTEASYRFERGIDPEAVVIALDRVASLIAKLSGGLIARGALDTGFWQAGLRTIQFRLSRAEAILGTKLEKKEVIGILRRLGLGVRSRGGDLLEVSPVSFRKDLEREIDLIEEVARVRGFGMIPLAFPGGKLKPSSPPSSFKAEQRAKRVISALGFYEAVNFSFIGREVFEALRLPEQDPLRRAVKLLNPLSEGEAYLRTLLLPGLLRSLAFNESHGAKRALLFEVGKTYHPTADGSLPEERLKLAAVAVGLREEFYWKGGKEEVDFYDVKGTLEALAQSFGVFLSFQAGEPVPYLNSTRQSQVFADGVLLGVIGQLHRVTAEQFSLSSLPYCFEIDLGALARLERTERRFVPLPKFPAVVRDVALLVPEETPAQEIQRTITKTCGELVEAVRVFDVYRGARIPPGLKSLAFSISYRSSHRTLTDDEVNAIHWQVLERLRERGWIPR